MRRQVRRRIANVGAAPITLRMAQSPAVEVHIVPSEKDASGAGEMRIPTAAPALTNTIFAATGVRICVLPIRQQLREAMTA